MQVTSHSEDHMYTSQLALNAANILAFLNKAALIDPRSINRVIDQSQPFILQKWL